jgi:ABC-2 type transport system ATP-binding protein
VIVVTEKLGHRYGDRDALKDLDLEVPPGEIFALVGPNGGGKSTLFRILSTLQRPTSGRAFVHGHDVERSPERVRREIGVAFQSPSLDDKLSVRENLVHQGHLYGRRGRDLRDRIDAVLRLFRLDDRAADRVETLSGGLARRVDLAKSLLHGPRLILLDEPSTGLDPAARRDLREALEEVRRRDGTSVLLTTHLLEEAEACDRVGILDRGRLVALGRPAQLVREIGGEVLTLATDDPERLASGIRERFGGEPTVAGGAVRWESESAAERLPEVLAAFPTRVRSATVARPTLADVFFHRAGREFREEESE